MALAGKVADDQFAPFDVEYAAAVPPLAIATTKSVLPIVPAAVAVHVVLDGKFPPATHVCPSNDLADTLVPLATAV